jgi:hypothetical protein
MGMAGGLMAGLAVLGAEQSDVAAAHPALSGVWILSNADPGGGEAPTQVEAVPMGGAPRPGSGATDGAGSGTTGGLGGFTRPAGGGANWADWGDKLPSTKPKRLSASEALERELTTPPEELHISLAPSTVVIDDGLAGPVTYRINRKTEAHQFINGSVKTKTFWDGPILRQEIDAGRNLKLVRTLELADDGRMHIAVGRSGNMPVKFAVVARGQDEFTPSADPRQSIYKRRE